MIFLKSEDFVKYAPLADEVFLQHDSSGSASVYVARSIYDIAWYQVHNSQGILEWI